MRISPVFPMIAFTLGVARVLCGCDGDDDCQVVCDKNVECQVDSPGEDDCIAICEELSEDQGYADALAEQADCYEDASCDELIACAPDFS
jgi:hypothetical protein